MIISVFTGTMCRLPMRKSYRQPWRRESASRRKLRRKKRKPLRKKKALACGITSAGAWRKLPLSGGRSAPMSKRPPGQGIISISIVTNALPAQGNYLWRCTRRGRSSRLKRRKAGYIWQGATPARTATCFTPQGRASCCGKGTATP